MTLRRLALLLAFCPAARAATLPTPSVLVRTQPVKIGVIQRTLTAYGTIGAGPGASDTVTLAYAGIVKQVDVVPGQSVQQGKILARIATAPSARATYIQAQARLHEAAQTLAHTRALVAAHLATAIQLAQAQRAETIARASRDALRQEGLGHTITAMITPYAGVIGAVAAMPGTALPAGSPIATILRADALVATVGLDPPEAHKVRIGDKVAITPFASTGHGTLGGAVLAIAAMVNPQSGLVDATIDVPDQNFLVGEQVTVHIDTGKARGVIVKRDVALPDGHHHFALWQVENGHAKEVDVHVIASEGDLSMVTGPIDPALPIVVSGNYQLKPGIAVRVKN